MYLSLLQSYGGELTLHARTALDPNALVATLSREVRTLDPTLPVYNLRTLEAQKDGSLYAERLSAALLMLFAVLGVVVAAVGIYGVLSYAVTERTHELGIRLAHGAQTSDLLKIVIRQRMTPTVIGLVVGLGAAFALTRLMQRLLFGVTATDPLTFAMIPLVLAIVALMACWIPAWRAARMNLLAALRYE